MFLLIRIGKEELLDKEDWLLSCSSSNENPIGVYLHLMRKVCLEKKGQQSKWIIRASGPILQTF
jgi:hypothetical protein